MYLSVIIPAYNEEKRLGGTLLNIEKYLSKQKFAELRSSRALAKASAYDYEIIVVNDGSKDKTAEAVKEMLPAIKNLKLIDNKINQGKGSAVRQGMLAAVGEYRLFTDADNSTSIDQIEKMWPYFQEEYDIVIGSRDVKGAILDPPQPVWRRMLGEFFGFLTNIFCGTWGIKDTQCGFKGFSKKAAENIFSKCKINRFAFDPEILIIAKKLGYKIKEIPVYWKNDPESRVKFSSMVKMGIDLLKIRLNLIKRVYAP